MRIFNLSTYFLAAIIFLAAPAQAEQLPIFFEEIVKNEVIAQYSKGWDDDALIITQEDIWGLEYSENTTEGCDIVVNGYAKKPSYHGKSTYQFWVCLTKDSVGSYEAELIDDIQISDE